MRFLTCPHCDRSLCYDEDAGPPLECSFCGRRLRTPSRDRRPAREEEDERSEEDVLEEAEEEEERAPRRRPRKRRLVVDDEEYEEECPGCGRVGRPNLSRQMCTLSWVFIGLGIMFWPLILLGIFYQETWATCRRCGEKIRKVREADFRI